MVKKLDLKYKDRALELYMGGMHIPYIIKKLEEEFGLPIKQSTAYRWVRDGSWKKKRELSSVKAMERMVEGRSYGIAKTTEEQLLAYRKLWKKGDEALSSLELDKFKDAIEAVDVGIQGERKIMMGMVAVAFVTDVFDAISEEVSDTELLNRIAQRLKKIVAASI